MNTPSGRIKAFNSSFYPCSIKEWCARSEEIRNIVSIYKFKLLIDIYTAASSLTKYSDEKRLKIILFGLKHFIVNANQSTLKSAIKFSKSPERFHDPLFL